MKLLLKISKAINIASHLANIQYFINQSFDKLWKVLHLHLIQFLLFQWCVKRISLEVLIFFVTDLPDLFKLSMHSSFKTNTKSNFEHALNHIHSYMKLYGNCNLNSDSFSNHVKNQGLLLSPKISIEIISKIYDAALTKWGTLVDSLFFVLVLFFVF